MTVDDTDQTRVSRKIGFMVKSEIAQFMKKAETPDFSK